MGAAVSCNFNPLPPCGGRPFPFSVRSYIWYFNPLPPCGGRRCCNSLICVSHSYFNPLPPCGGRHVCHIPATLAGCDFNPLPPCGGRRSFFTKYTTIQLFQSTPSVWRETRSCSWMSQHLRISIHSLRVEGDPAIHQALPSPFHFNPLPPCGGRRDRNKKTPTESKFQSTPSVWRETMTCGSALTSAIFQSTPSVWRETKPLGVYCADKPISIHSLRVEGDCRHAVQSLPAHISIHSLRVEGDR